MLSVTCHAKSYDYITNKNKYTLQHRKENPLFLINLLFCYFTQNNNQFLTPNIILGL